TSNCDPGWIPVGNLQYNMQMIGQIQFNGVTSFNANDIVGAFVGEVCRGIASPMGDGGLIFLTVGSNAASGEQVTFKLWNAQTCQQCNSSAVITFENQALIGNPGAPYIFSCAAANPELNATPSSLSFGIVQTGNCSTLSYLLTGSNLTANVTVTAPTGFQVSNSAGSGFANAITVTQSGGNVNQTVYVRFCPVAAQAYSGNVSNATSGASTVNVLVSGEGQYPPLPELFNVGGGGSYCAGTTPTGVSVTLNSSQSNITYQLKKNGTAFGSPINGTGNALLWTNQTAGIYTVDANNGYQTVQMTGSAVITESPILPVSVSVQASANNVCAGTQVSFTASPVNGGTNPAYQWKVNGINVGGNNLSYSYVPVNNDVVTVVLTSNANCTSGNPATSNAVTMAVNPLLPVSVSVQASANNVCAGTQVSFTASPVNGGANPTYQWKKNGNNVGGNSPSYSYVPVNNDVVTVVLTSNANCTSVNPATSNAVTMAVNPLPQVSWNNFEPDTLCIFWEPMQLTGGLPLGGNYSGTGVSANFFSPSTAGYGSHTLLYTYTNEFNCTASANFTVFVDLCTSIVEKNVENEKVFVYPNPANTVLTIKFNDPYLLAFEHKIFNVLGQIVKEDRKTLKNGSLIHLEGLPTGFYFLQIMFDTTQTTTTFIIK
ncbi:MAG: T9SS type A sorting domain-containing protein, partial [Bacteroidales bacterium]|nr:T9SS type A sorting domain-containing protein [Bacteroidales bacterium]